jgi:homoserine kinase
MPNFLPGEVSVTVPATSANLGPGYDALGLALSLRDRVTARVLAPSAAESDRPEISVTGEGEWSVPLTSDHLVHRSMAAAFAEMRCPLPVVRLHCANAIPHGRGLGSSSAAIVAGVCAARALVAGGSLLMDDDAVFTLAAALEGHPDNVAPAFYGGFTVAWAEGERFRAVGVSVDPRVAAVAFVPPDPVETTVARGLLPGAVSHADAAANAGRAALLVAALGGRPELLLAATEDRLHQDYREPAMPESLALVRALRDEGLPAVVSGAGPTVLVLVDDGRRADLLDRVPEGWRAVPLSVEHNGADVEFG